MKQPILSIIVPVYNVEPYLERCLLSCLRQDIPQDDYEIIVVNDGSTDGSRAVAERMAGGNGNIKVYSKENGGASSARNYGLKKASGKYVMFVDSDDYLFENVLRSLVQQCEKNHLDVLCFWTCFDYKKKTCDTEHQPFRECEIYTGEYVLLHGLRIDSVWQFLFKSELFRQLSSHFREGIACSEDVLFIMKLFPYVNRILFTHTKVYHYCIDHLSVSRINDSGKQFKMIVDQLHVIFEIREFTKDANLISSSIRDYYIRRMNSLEVSHFLAFFMQKYPWRYINDYIKEARQLGLYPIKGKTLSVKTTMLIPVINSRPYRWFLRICSIKNNYR